MKKLIILIIILLNICLIGCSKKITITINDNPGLIITRPNGDEKSKAIHYIQLEQSCYLFRNYDELLSFFTEYNLMFAREETKNRYNEEFFKNNVMVLYYCIEGQRYRRYFSLKKENNSLLLSIDKYEVGGTEEVRKEIFIIEAKKSSIESTNTFEYHINIYK